MLANVSNKAYLYLAYYNANPDRSHKELTNTSKLCKNHLKNTHTF